ncbi:plant basic secretory protein, partial [Fistulina hepatica ATCC 64428]
PEPEPTWPYPRFDLRVEDISHPGAILFFRNIDDIESAMREAVTASFKFLYTPETTPANVKTIQLVLRAFPGIAYTHGTSTFKEIHLSLEHIESSSARARDEIMGTLVHEMAHCYQNDARGACPDGLIEGIADYVRLRARYVPPHWKRVPGDTWDSGNQYTGYFLDWIESRQAGSVKDLNDLIFMNYDDDVFRQVVGHALDDLWQMYCS